MSKRLTINGIEKIEYPEYASDGIKVKFFKKERTEYAFTVEYKDETYIVRMNRFTSKVLPNTIYDPDTFYASRVSHIVFEGYNAYSAEKLSKYTLSTNILDPADFVRSIHQYISWNIDLPF